MKNGYFQGAVLNNLGGGGYSIQYKEYLSHN